MKGLYKKIKWILIYNLETRDIFYSKLYLGEYLKYKILFTETFKVFFVESIFVII